MHKCTECGSLNDLSCIYSENNKAIARKVCGDCFLTLANKKQIKKEAYRLRIAIYFHKQLYYKYDQPIMEDHIFDKLERLCWKLESVSPFDMKLSSRLKVGDHLPACYFIKVNGLIKEHFRIIDEEKRLENLINGGV